MRVIEVWRAADSWLLETKFQKASEWLHDHLGLSSIRSTQIWFALACCSSLAAAGDAVVGKYFCFTLAALSGSLVLLCEVLEFLRRLMESRSGATVDLSGTVSAEVRLGYCSTLIPIVFIGIVARRSNIEDIGKLEPGFVLLGMICMIIALYFAGCKSKPRKPLRKKSLELGFAGSE